jgi:HAD superfamily hydrolase (TIGR01484 family)
MQTHQFNPQCKLPPAVLATDLDGTLIPMDGNPHQISALRELKLAVQDASIPLIFATGRHLHSVLEAIKAYHLPIPKWLICDVGTSIFEYSSSDNDFVPFLPYKTHLKKTVGDIHRDTVEQIMRSVNDLHLQAPENQTDFKISYTAPTSSLAQSIEDVNLLLEKNSLPYCCMGSIDPFLNCGLVDILPHGVNKAYSLIWLSTHADFPPDALIYAGDSGNDLAALTSGFRAIIVGNATDALTKSCRHSLQSRGLQDRLYVARGHATSGVLEGCQYFGLIKKKGSGFSNKHF